VSSRSTEPGGRGRGKSGTYDPEALCRELYRPSQALTRSAHALDAAAAQLREAHSRDHGKAATEVCCAALVAMHAALSAYELIGGYDLAEWIVTQGDGGKGE
jgi:hypothetical protein